MRVILFMVMTANGMIAGDDDAKDWSSKEDWDGFVAMAKKVGNIIIGRRTYDVARKTTGLLDVVKLRVVLTHHTDQQPVEPQTVFMNAPPAKILEYVLSKGYDTALIAGGSFINSLFMKAGLVDELYLTVEPVIIGRGIPLFADGDFQSRLKLLEVKTLANHQTIQLHYRVLK